MKRVAVVTGVALIVAGAVTVAGQRGAGAGQAPMPEGVVVLGQVVDAVTGLPVAGATVSVTNRASAATANPAGPAGRGWVASTVQLLTGADGKFVVRDLPAGTLGLTASAPGYLSASHGQTRPNGQAQPIIPPSDGKVIVTKIRMWRTAAITGVVTDQRGEPLPGIQVRAYLRTYQRGQPRFQARGFASTDDRGMYRLAGLAPGDYIAVVPQTLSSSPAAVMDGLMKTMASGMTEGFAAAMEMGLSGAAPVAFGLRIGDMTVGTQGGRTPVPGEGGRWLVSPTRFAPGVDVASQASVLALRAGDDRAGVDIALPLVPTVSLTGVVTGPDGPVANVAVRLRHAGEQLLADQTADVAVATTRPDGSFAMPAVPVGHYVIRVLRTPRPQMGAAQLAGIPEEMRASMAAMFAGGGDTRTFVAETAVNLERDVAGLAITVGTGARLTGQLEFSGAGELPTLEGTTVGLSAINSDWAVGMLQSANTGAQINADRTFTTAGFPPGRYTVVLGGRLPSPWVVKSVVINGRDVTYDAFELRSSDIAGALVTLTDKRATIAGSVQGSSELEPADTSVVLFPAAWREWIAGGMHTALVRTVRPDAKGAFTLATLPAHEYFVVALPSVDAPDMQDPAVFEALARDAERVVVAEGETRTVSLRVSRRPGAAIDGALH